MKILRGLTIGVGVLVLTLALNVKSIDYSKLENSNITEINGEKVEGIKVSDRYKEYTNSIDFYVGEDNGIVVFYKSDFSDISIVDNR